MRILGQEGKLMKTKGSFISTFIIVVFVVLTVFSLLENLTSSKGIASDVQSGGNLDVDFKTEDKVLYNQNEISVELLSMDSDANGFRFQIVNNSERDISYSIINFSINGWEVLRNAFQTVYAGAKDTLHFELTKDEISLYKMNGIEFVDFKLSYHYDDEDTRLDNASIHFETTLAGNNNFYQAEDFTLYIESDGLDVYLATTDDKYYPYYLMFVNSKDRDANITYKDVAFDNEMVSLMMSGAYVNANSKLIVPGLYTANKTSSLLDLDEVSEFASNVKYKINVLFYKENGGFSTGDAHDIGVVDLEFDKN